MDCCTDSTRNFLSCTTLLALLKVAFENKVVKEGVAAVN